MTEWDGRTTPHAAEGPQWVSAAEAADAAGVTPGTVRYWARNGLIVSEVAQGPAGERTLVRLDEVLQHARQGAASAPGDERRAAPPAPPSQVVTELPARTSELAPILKSIPEIMAQLTAATDRAARAETKVEFLSAQLAEMRRQLAEAQGGAAASTAGVVPEAWEPEPQPAIEEAAPGAGWVTTGEAASAEPDMGAATSDPPAETAGWGDTAAGAIDWGSSETSAGGTAASAIDWAPAAPAEPAPAEERPSTETAASDEEDAPSLGEIWGEPAGAADPAPEPAEEVPAPVSDPASWAAPEPADTMQWHEPAGNGVSESGSQPPAPPPARPANATFPDEDVYGPRRRRWFKRRG